MKIAMPLPVSPARPAEVDEQLDQVDLDVAGVGPSANGRDVDAGLPPRRPLSAPTATADRRRFALGERLQDAEQVGRLALGRAEFADRRVQRGGQRLAQRAIGTDLELAGAPAAPHRGRAQRVEQHGLADTAQPGQHDRSLGPRPSDPFEQRRRRRAARRRGRRVRAGAGRRRGRRGCGPGPRSDCIRLSSGFLRLPKIAQSCRAQAADTLVAVRSDLLVGSASCGLSSSAPGISARRTRSR